MSNGTSRTGEEFALIQGLRDTRGALDRWRADPGPILGGWFSAALAVAVGLLLAVWFVSLVSPADLTWLYLIGVYGPPDVGDYLLILARNLLVLALHATACVAGFIAGSSLGKVAATKTGLSRIVHEKAGPIAIAWIVFVTAFSLFTQALALGFDAATIAGQLEISTGMLLLSVLPHALIELVAVFLPLAAWLVASRRGDWDDLLAATLATVAIALPMLLIAVGVELLLWPLLVEVVSPVV